MAKNNYAMKAPQPDSFHDDEAWKWPSVEARRDSIPDPAKVLSPARKEELKRQEDEAFERFKKAGLRAKGTGKSTGMAE